MISDLPLVRLIITWIKWIGIGGGEKIVLSPASLRGLFLTQWELDLYISTLVYNWGYNKITATEMGLLTPVISTRNANCLTNHMNRDSL
jgi:hypothetical protein